MDISISAAAPPIAYSTPASSSVDDYPKQAENTDAARYGKIMTDVKDQPRFLFKKVATSLIRDVLPNIVAEMVEEWTTPRMPRSRLKSTRKMTFWEHRSARPLMQ